MPNQKKDNTNQNNIQKKPINVSAKYEFADDELGENREEQFEELRQEEQNQPGKGKKC